MDGRRKVRGRGFRVYRARMVDGKSGWTIEDQENERVLKSVNLKEEWEPLFNNAGRKRVGTRVKE